jgi:hypothetical protein
MRPRRRGQQPPSPGTDKPGLGTALQLKKLEPALGLVRLAPAGLVPLE